MSDAADGLGSSSEGSAADAAREIEAIDHIGIAVDSLEGALPFWAEALGLPVGGIETVDTERVKVAFLPTGAGRLELLEATEPSSTIAKHLDKRGAGVHHVTLRVADIEATLDRLRSHDVTILGGTSRPGAEGSTVAFIHPKSTGGVLLELVQPATTDLGAPDAPPPACRDIAPGSPVLVYLREPQEKLWGVLRRLDHAGIVFDGVDLNSFDDWMAQIERGEESVVGPSLLFVPMGRVDKLLLDCSSGHLPSLAERFYRRVGRSVQSVLGSLDAD